ncbi:hypothetical protein PsorP6_003020 [Peronosclerospora sorghi]|uniref:Uncharacterized protein n=1 Tax=Peronosclerospora sorghi TaxID=230839 RepID=A0ACC0VRH0_9STRA|nr:hypothetical protein PsorP6_003020 [Peronosclerospora sorghi]
MSLGTCIQTVIELKEKEDGDEINLPIVIHFENAHYQGYIHGWRGFSNGKKVDQQDQDELMTDDDDEHYSLAKEDTRLPPSKRQRFRPTMAEIDQDLIESSHSKITSESQLMIMKSYPVEDFTGKQTTAIIAQEEGASDLEGSAIW